MSIALKNISLFGALRCHLGIYLHLTFSLGAQECGGAW